jgi:FAD/FMN-containing dehydrogenase
MTGAVATIPSALPQLLAELAGIPVTTHPAQLKLKSRDFFWYSPVLAQRLKGKVGDAVFTPRDVDEVRRIASACARHGANLTLRGGGTGNYGQCVPLQGGVILETTSLDKVLEIVPGRVRVQTGAKIAAVEEAARREGQSLLMWPSTKRLATIGGFIAGGFSGIGSIRHGILKDAGNVTRIGVMTVEAEPRIIELVDADIQKVHHAFGTNGIILDLDIALAPAVTWWHMVALFDSYADTLRFSMAACDPRLDLFLLTNVDRRFHPFYRALGEHFPAGKDAVFAMVAPDSRADFAALAASHGGTVSLDTTEDEIERRHLLPAYECAYNHTTLQALKLDRSWTYLQLAYPDPFDIALVERQMARLGDELYMHHEFALAHGQYRGFALPLLKWSNRERLYEVIRDFERDGCVVFDPHVYTIEEGGMKTIGRRSTSNASPIRRG